MNKMTKIYLKHTENESIFFKLPELIKDIFPEKQHYINAYFGDIIKISFPSNILIVKHELTKLNKIITIVSFSYDKDMDRIVIMGYINGA